MSVRGSGQEREDFEAYCVTSASLRDRGEAERHAILIQLNLDASWSAIESRWAHVLLDDIARGDLERVMRYGDACALERSRRQNGQDRHRELLSREAKPSPPQNAGSGFSPSGTIAHDPRAAALPAGNDFRRGLYERPPSAGAPAAHTPSGAGGNFIEALMPSGPAPQVATPNQAVTGTGSFAEIAATTTAALAWPVERYAAFCASRALRPHEHAEVARHFGVVAEAVAGVDKGWRRKLTASAALQDEFQRAYGAAVRRG